MPDGWEEEFGKPICLPKLRAGSRTAKICDRAISAKPVLRKLVGNLDLGLGYGRWLVCDRHSSVMVSWRRLRVKICISKLTPDFGMNGTRRRSLAACSPAAKV